MIYPKSITPKFDCSIKVPINDGNTQSFTQKRRNNKTEEIKTFEFNKNETKILFEWFNELKQSFGYCFSKPGRTIIKVNMINKVFANANNYFRSKTVLLHKKISKIFTIAINTSTPVEIQTSLSSEFRFSIIVPLNKKGYDQIEHCHENKACQEEWHIHEKQVQILLDKFLYQIASEYNIPFMDTTEEPVLPRENVPEILEKIKLVNKKNKIEIEAFSFLQSALELANEKNMPVYLFF